MVGWEDFIVQLAATLIGVTLGIPIALWLNNQYSGYKKKDEKETLINFLRENLGSNLNILKKMQSDFAHYYVVHEPLDIGSWSMFSQKINLLNKLDLQRKILHVYYNLEQLSKIVTIQLEMHYSAFRAMTGYKQEREYLVRSIQGQIGSLIKEIEEILKELSKSA